MKAFGTSIPGSFTMYMFTGLDQNANYYAWILVVKGISESDAKASTPTYIRKNFVIYNSYPHNLFELHEICIDHEHWYLWRVRKLNDSVHMPYKPIKIRSSSHFPWPKVSITRLTRVRSILVQYIHAYGFRMSPN